MSLFIDNHLEWEWGVFYATWPSWWLACMIFYSTVINFLLGSRSGGENLSDTIRHHRGKAELPKAAPGGQNSAYPLPPIHPPKDDIKTTAQSGGTLNNAVFHWVEEKNGWIPTGISHGNIKNKKKCIFNSINPDWSNNSESYSVGERHTFYLEVLLNVKYSHVY